MKIKRSDSGTYETEDGKFTIQREFSNNFQWVIYKSDCRWSTCKTLAEAKIEVKLYYV